LHSNYRQRLATLSARPRPTVAGPKPNSGPNGWIGL
jgi:hypothetical protein